MPAESQAQQMFMGAMLAEQRRTGHNKTGMSERQLREYAGTKRKGLPKRKSKRR